MIATTQSPAPIKNRPAPKLALALNVIKIQMGLLSALIVILIGVSAFTERTYLPHVPTLLLDLVVIAGLFMFIKNESKLAAVLYILLAIFTYFRVVSLDISLLSLLPMLDAILSLIATYGIIQWWRHKVVTL